ncbi:MAG: hypothetical protein LUE93_06010 [Bacteroides sp.]|nr:hypothetical protein [Bacteroides sp.]
MKKLFLLFISIFTYAGIINAQDDCLEFFPTTEGSTLVSKSYDGNNNLLSTMTSRVTSSYGYASGTDIELEFTMTDANNNVIDRGTINANCNDGDFYLKMDNRAYVPNILDVLSMDTQLVGSFLDYPDTFREDYIYNGPFQMDAGEFTIKSKIDSSEKMRVSVRNREYEKNEKISTPAGDFHASKIKFTVETYENGTANTYKGIEWYAVKAGIVRTEIYNQNDNLLNYTVLTDLDVK